MSILGLFAIIDFAWRFGFGNDRALRDGSMLAIGLGASVFAAVKVC